MTTTEASVDRASLPSINWWATIPIWLIHLLPFLAFLTGVPWWNWVLMGGAVRGADVLHHRRLPPLLRPPRATRPRAGSQFVLAFGGAHRCPEGSAVVGGQPPLHHRYVDTDTDAHTPIKGFWWSHIGWILSDGYDEIPDEAIDDFAEVPRASLARQPQLGPALGARRDGLPGRRLVRPADRLLPLDRAAVARARSW